MRIWISGVGGPTQRSSARSLRLAKDRWPDLHLVGSDCNRLAAGLYDFDLFDETVVVPQASDPAYWPSISREISDRNIEFAFIQPEQEVLEWARRRANGDKWPCAARLPERDLVEVVLDKARMTEVLRDTGWVPHTIEVDPLHPDAEAVQKELGFPCWIRSASGSSGLGALRVDTPEALTHWISLNSGVERFIASTYLPGRNLACLMLFDGGTLVRAGCAERVQYAMAKTAPSGVTGNTSYGRLLNHPELVDLSSSIVRALADATGAEPDGFMTADFKEDDSGRPFLTEVNARLVAFNFSFAQAGANISADMLSLATAERGNTPIDSRIYEFSGPLAFLRDIDSYPLLLTDPMAV